MFVLKKGFRLTISLAFFFSGNECANLAVAGLCGAGIYFLAAAGYLFNSVLAVIALLLFVCIHFCKIYKQLYSRRRINKLLVKPYAVVLAVAGVCYFVAADFCIYCFGFVSCTDMVITVLYTVTVTFPFFECLLEILLEFFSVAGSIISFDVYTGNSSCIENPECTINAETGIKVNSGVPEFNRSVKIGMEYFAVNGNNDLVIVEYGKQKEEAVIIPKESVTDITFTTITGVEKKVCYSNGVWCRL